MCAAIFVQIEVGKSTRTQLGSATKVALAVFVILTVAALMGVKVLHLFRVSLDVFMEAAGPGCGHNCNVALIVLVARLGGRGSGGFVHDTLTRFMGLIVIAMGIQFRAVWNPIIDP